MCASGVATRGDVCASAGIAIQQAAEAEIKIAERRIVVRILSKSSVSDAGFDRRVVYAREYVVDGECLVDQLEVGAVTRTAQPRNLREHQFEILK
jgi:hypothetical protein